APAGAYTGTASTELFQDVRVRQAFAYCVDRAGLAKGGAAPDSYLPFQHPLSADVLRYRFNPQQGRTLLAQAGWADTNGDGLLDKAGVALTVTLAGDADHQPLAQAIQAQLQKNCGVGVALRALTAGELRGDWPDGVVFGRRYDLAVFDWD